MLGYGAQYLISAGLIYERLLDGRLEWIAVADPEAGRIDDVQIATPGCLDAYQIKWHEFPPSLTYSELKGGTGAGDRGLIGQLADGWRALRGSHPDRRVRVHLFTNSHPSTTPIEAVKEAGTAGLPHHLAAFLAEIWRPAQPDIAGRPESGRWQACSDAFEAAAALPPDLDFASFQANCLIDTGQHLPATVPRDSGAPSSARERDIEDLAALLIRVVSRERSVVRLGREELLRRLDWAGRFEFRVRHDFPVGRAYAAIDETVAELGDALRHHTGGYIALLGTPGSGKSSLLTASFKSLPGFRVVRYYCFVPDDGGLARGEASGFLHDLTLALWQENIRPHGASLGSDIESSRALFRAQLAMLQADYRANGLRTLILVDGLDHVEREQRPQWSLMAEFPPPASVPDGTLILLGSQKLELAQLPPRIAQQLRQEARTVRMRPLPPRAVREVIAASGIEAQLDDHAIESVVQRSAGHPLALAYLLNRVHHARTLQEAKQAIDLAPPHADRIEVEYELYWENLEQDADVRELLALAGRLRGPLDLAAAAGWVGEAAVRKLQKSAGQYFSSVGETRWRFFHNSFRQFVCDRTGHGPFGAEGADLGRRHHRKLAELAGAAPTSNPFTWERLYHAFHAGEMAGVVAVATQGWFRQQLLSGRPGGAVRGDIEWALRAATAVTDPLAVVRLLLIDEEIAERAHCLDDVNLARLHLVLGDPDAALTAAADDGGPKIGQARALELAAELHANGHIAQARRLFQAAEPLDVVRDGRKLERWGREHKDVLVAWVEAAPRFMPLQEVTAALDQLHVEADSIGECGEDAASVSRRVAEALTRRLVEGLASRGDVDACRRVLGGVEARFGPACSAHLALQADGILASMHPMLLAGREAVARLAERHAAHTLPPEFRLLVADKLLRVGGDEGAARRLVQGVERPDSLAWRLASHRAPKTLGQFAVLFRLGRLRAALGLAIEPEVAAAKSTDPDRAGDILLEDMILRVAWVWGMAWRGGMGEPGLVWRSLLPAVHLQERSVQDRGRPHRAYALWEAYHSVSGEYFELVVRAAAAHGRTALERLGDELDARWNASGTKRCWPAPLQRQVALALWRAGDGGGRLERRLDALEVDLGRGGSVTERASEFEEQILAWAALGQVERGRALFSRMLEGTYGIYHDKDAQLGCWTQWVRKALRRAPDVVAPDVAPFMAGLARAAVGGIGRDPAEAAAAALEAVAEHRSALDANAYRKAFLDRGALGFIPGLVALCNGGVRRGAVGAPLLAAIVAHVVLPHSEQVLPDLVGSFGQVLCGVPEEQAARTVAWVEVALDTDAPPGCRLGWRQAFTEGAAKSRHASLFGNMAEPLPPPPDQARGGWGNEYARVTLRDGTVLDAAEVRRRARDRAGLIGLLAATEESSLHEWSALVRPLAPAMSAAEVVELTTELRRVGARARDLEPLWERLRVLGSHGLLEADARASLEGKPGYGWYKYMDGGSRLLPFQVLISLDEAYRVQALQASVSDYLGDARSPKQALDNLDDLVDLFWADPPTRELWLEIREHVFQLAEFRDAPRLAVTVEEGENRVEGEQETTFTEVLAGALFNALLLPQPEFREDVYKGVLRLLDDPCTRPIALRHTESLLSSEGDGALLGLSLLEHSQADRKHPGIALISGRTLWIRRH